MTVEELAFTIHEAVCTAYRHEGRNALCERAARAVLAARTSAATADTVWPCDNFMPPVTCYTTPKPKTLICQGCKEAFPDGHEVAGLFTATADTGYVWKRNDQADHEAGHPSGYDCNGYAMSSSEACGHRYAATADTGLRERVEALAEHWEAWDHYARDNYGEDPKGREYAKVLRQILDATAAPTTDTGARDE